MCYWCTQITEGLQAVLDGPKMSYGADMELYKTMFYMGEYEKGADCTVFLTLVWFNSSLNSVLLPTTVNRVYSQNHARHGIKG